MDESKAVAALADAVRSRRAELGLTHDAVLAAGGPSGVTLTKIESASGPVPRPSTLKKLDKALDWRPGSSARVLKGAVPTPLSFQSEEHRVEFVANTLSLAEQVRKRAQLGYLELAMTVANFIENPPPLELRQDLASRWRTLTTAAVIQYLVQLDPKGDAPELAARASKLLTPEGQARAEGAMDNFRTAADFLERARSSSLAEGGSPIPPPPEPDGNDPVTSLVDRRPVPPPPAMDSLDVAASQREKQSERSGGGLDGPEGEPEEGLEPRSLADLTTVVGELGVLVPDFIRAEIPPELIAAHDNASTALVAEVKAISVAYEQQEVTAARMALLLLAVDNYVAISRSMVGAMQAHDLHATQEQVDSALPVFDNAQELGYLVSELLEYLILGAPTDDERARVSARQQSLEELGGFLRNAHDAWVESGLSSKTFDRQRAGVSRPRVSRVRRNVPDLTVDEFLPGGVDPTSPGDKQADHG